MLIASAYFDGFEAHTHATKSPVPPSFKNENLSNLLLLQSNQELDLKQTANDTRQHSDHHHSKQIAT